MNRRRFVAAAGAASAAFGANDLIQVGVIGTGGRARMLMKSLTQLPGVNIASVCDVWDEHLRLGSEIAPKASTTKDHRRLLDNKDLDAVLIGTPDHWHTPLTIAASQAGKDVYVEKPLTHEIGEGRAVIDAQNRHKRIVQVGMQQRSMPQMQKARDIIRAGRIGKVHKVRMTWNRNHSERLQRRAYNINPASVDWQRFLGNAPRQPFDEYRFRNWRWFWDFGGGTATDLGVHHLDIANWILDLERPASAVAVGSNYATKGLWETPDTFQMLLDYPDRSLQIHFEATFVNARDAAMIEIMGTEATVYLDRGRYELHPERTGHNSGAERLPYEEMVLGEGPRGTDFYKTPDGEALHLQNWIECMRTRKPPIAPAEAGVLAADGAHLANIALRRGTVARGLE